MRTVLLFVAGLALSGCVVHISLPSSGEPIRAAKANRGPGFVPSSLYFRVVSVKPVFAVHYKEAITKSRQTPQPRIATPVVLSEGRYHNWRWVIQADPGVAIQWRRWHRILDDAATARGGRVSSALLHWRAMMKRLYRLDAYLLGRPPLPVDFQLLLRSPGRYHYQAIVRSKRALPVRMVFAIEPERTRHKLETAEMSVLNGINFGFQAILVISEWKYNALPKPLGESAHKRHLKGDADIAAWAAAADAALLGGSSDLPPEARRALYTPFRHQRYGHALVQFLEHQNADLMATQLALATQLVRWDWRRYLQRRKLPLAWPRHGSVLVRYANATIDLSWALTRYQGNILRWKWTHDQSRKRGFFSQPPPSNRP